MTSSPSRGYDQAGELGSNRLVGDASPYLPAPSYGARAYAHRRGRSKWVLLDRLSSGNQTG